jgi:hypothetical protein
MLFTRVFAGLVCAALLAGCAGSKPTPAKRVKVSGNVTVEGKPLQTGRVVFDPSNGEPPTSLDVLDGYYEGLAVVGKNKVRISSFRKTSMKEKMKMDGPGYDELVEENILPPRYNTASEIVREVTEGQSNEFNFKLQLK